MRRSQIGVYHRFAHGPDFDLYMHELGWRHSNRSLDTKARWEDLVSIVIRSPPSRRFRGAFQY